MRTYRRWTTDETVAVQSQAKVIIEKKSNYYRSAQYLATVLDRTYNAILSKLQNEYIHLKKNPMLYLITPQGKEHIFRGKKLRERSDGQ